MTTTRRTTLLALTAALNLLWGSTSQAQTAWKPDHSVTIVVPYAPGGSVDAMARATAKALSTKIGQPVIVENQPGADGLIGTKRVIDSKPDGQTLLFQIPAITITKYMPGLKGIDPLLSLAPVTSIAETPLVIVSTAKTPAKTLPELIAYCRTATEPCSVGTSEATGRIRSKEFGAVTGLNSLITVNYRGTGPMVSDLISGIVTMAFLNIPGVLPHHRSGTMRILAVEDSKRSSLIPDIPTTAEAGYPQFKGKTWYGLFAPKGTPAATVNAIAKALHDIRDDADLQRTIGAGGAVTVFNSPQEFAAQVSDDDKTWNGLVKRFPLE